MRVKEHNVRRATSKPSTRSSLTTNTVHCTLCKHKRQGIAAKFTEVGLTAEVLSVACWARFAGPFCFPSTLYIASTAYWPQIGCHTSYCRNRLPGTDLCTQVRAPAVAAAPDSVNFEEKLPQQLQLCDVAQCLTSNKAHSTMLLRVLTFNCWGLLLVAKKRRMRMELLGGYLKTCDHVGPTRKHSQSPNMYTSSSCLCEIVECPGPGTWFSIQTLALS